MEAEAILRFALYKEVLKRRHRRKKRKLNQGGAAGHPDGEDGDGSDESESDEDEAPARMATPKPAQADAGEKDKSKPADPVWGAESQDIDMDDGGAQGKAAAEPSDDGTIPAARLTLWRTRLAKLFSTSLQDDEQWFLVDLLATINEGLTTDELFSTAEATAACQAMSDVNELMLSDGIVYKI